MTGKIISHYKILEKLDSGGMGEVYKAEDTKLQRTVALKFFPPELTRDEDAKTRFRKEAIAASALDHNNIGTIHEIVETEDYFFIAMSYYEGGTLKDAIDSNTNGLDVNEALDFAIQIADGLDKAHSKDIVHRDVKPANILVTGENQIKIIDFGLAKLKGSSLVTKSGTTLGTVAYMSPEQIECKTVDERSDVWSLGVILYEMLAGQKPFQGEYEHGVMYKILNEEPEFITRVNNRVPRQIERIIEKSLFKDPEKRYANMSVMLNELKIADSELREGLHERSPAFRMNKKQRKNALRVTVITLFVFVAGLYFIVNRIHESQPVSIALLPLQSRTDDAEQEWLTDSMTDALITDLAKISGLRIISRASAMQYKGSAKTTPEIAAELGVRYLIEGSIVKVEDQVKISARLINAMKDEYIWGQEYERAFNDILQLQGELAQTIANQIQVKLTPQEVTRLAISRSVNPQTHELYLKGMYHLNKFTPEGIGKGLQYLHQAANEDPDEPLTHAGLALAYGLIAHTPSPPPGALEMAKEEVKKALQLDESLAEVHLTLGMIKIFQEWDKKGARDSFEYALELNPNLAMARAHYSYNLMIHGEMEEALKQMKMAQTLNPLDPLFPAWHAWVYFWLGRNDDAIIEARKSIELVQDYPIALYILGCAYAAKGMFPEAIEAHQRVSEVAPDYQWSLGQSYALAGKRDEAMEIVRQLESKPNVWETWGIAEIYTALDNKDKAFEWLNAAYEQKHPYVQWLWRNCSLNPLHDDPRFLDLSEKLNLSDESSS